MYITPIVMNVSNAIEEGIEFLWLSNPKKFIGRTQVEAVEVTKMELGEAASSGRKKPISIKSYVKYLEKGI